MSKARLVITAVTVEKRPVGEVAGAYGVARSWIYTLLARYRAEGEAAFEPRSRRPKTSPSAIGDATVALIIELRKDLSGQGLDAGPDTIAWHLEHHHQVRVPAAAVARYLARHGLVVPEPRKRPRSSYIRFAAEQPNESWQAGFTHYPLASGAGTEILTWLDDHSRCALRVTAWNRVTGPIVLAEFRAAAARYGPPAFTLTDNGMVFTTRLSGGRGGRNAFEHELRRRGITQKNGKPNHPPLTGHNREDRAAAPVAAKRASQRPRPVRVHRGLAGRAGCLAGGVQHRPAAPVPGHGIPRLPVHACPVGTQVAGASTPGHRLAGSRSGACPRTRG